MMFYCEECDRLLDGDWVEAEDMGDDKIICLDCAVRLEAEEEINNRGEKNNAGS